jgi:hypothetical protein
MEAGKSGRKLEGIFQRVWNTNPTHAGASHTKCGLHIGGGLFLFLALPNARHRHRPPPSHHAFPLHVRVCLRGPPRYVLCHIVVAHVSCCNVLCAGTRCCNTCMRIMVDTNIATPSVWCLAQVFRSLLLTFGVSVCLCVALLLGVLVGHTSLLLLNLIRQDLRSSLRCRARCMPPC